MKKQKIKKIIRNIVVTWACFLAFFVFSGAVSADGVDNALSGLDTSAREMNGGDTSTMINDLPSTIGRVVGAILAFVGVLFFILIIYSGVTWMMARGNESQVQKAKDMLEAAVIGLIIVMSAYAITAYIGDSLLSN